MFPKTFIIVLAIVFIAITNLFAQNINFTQSDSDTVSIVLPADSDTTFIVLFSSFDYYCHLIQWLEINIEEQRTILDQFSEWKKKYGDEGSPYDSFSHDVDKYQNELFEISEYIANQVERERPVQVILKKGISSSKEKVNARLTNIARKNGLIP